MKERRLAASGLRLGDGRVSRTRNYDSPGLSPGLAFGTKQGQHFHQSPRKPTEFPTCLANEKDLNTAVATSTGPGAIAVLRYGSNFCGSHDLNYADPRIQ